MSCGSLTEFTTMKTATTYPLRLPRSLKDALTRVARKAVRVSTNLSSGQWQRNFLPRKRRRSFRQAAYAAVQGVTLHDRFLSKSPSRKFTRDYRVCGPSSEWRRGDECERMPREILEVFCQAPTAIEPRNRPFDNPPRRRNRNV